ncbi:MAG: hypothetical protein K2M92_02590, partial [Bacteroidales bacterium]|nr:hypothetical protein [Bacteroidales bacterium]
MKSFRLFLWVVLPFFMLCGPSFAGDKTGIRLGLIVPAQDEPLSEEEESYISEKLVQMASANGIEASKDFSRFFV